jgi:hypothetical protein
MERHHMYGQQSMYPNSEDKALSGVESVIQVLLSHMDLYLPI